MEKTERGFSFLSFTDADNVKCTLQESSSIESEGLIRFGCQEIGLKRLQPGQGWTDIPLEQDPPNGVLHSANTRMHLTQSQVRDLLPALQYFAEHGRLPQEDLPPLHAENAETVRYCQPRYMGKDHPRKFIVMFEDSEVGNSVFDNEDEAYDFYYRASWNWNCYLFGTMPERQSKHPEDPA